MSTRDYVSEWKRLAADLDDQVEIKTAYPREEPREEEVPITLFRISIDPPAQNHHPIWMILSAIFITITAMVIIL